MLVTLSATIWSFTFQYFVNMVSMDDERRKNLRGAAPLQGHRTLPNGIAIDSC